MTTTVSVHELHECIHEGKSGTLLFVHWDADETGGETSYHSAHIPTAQYCNPTIVLAGLPGSDVGRNPLPDPDFVQAAFTRWGLRTDRPVFVYDEGPGVLAGRAWWVLRWAGVQDVRIVDGGLAAWEKEGFHTIGGPGHVPLRTDVTVEPGSMQVATIDEVREHTGILLDTRDARRFAGVREIYDLEAGHIPGAKNIPVTDFLYEDDTMRPDAEIAERLAQEGITDGSDVIVYSGSGNHSALAIAAMENAGITGVRHFVGGWSQWSADPKNPVERGHAEVTH